MTDHFMMALAGISLGAILLPWVALGWVMLANQRRRHIRPEQVFAEWDEFVRQQQAINQRAVVTSAVAQAHLQRVLAAHAAQRQANDRDD